MVAVHKANDVIRQPEIHMFIIGSLVGSAHVIPCTVNLVPVTIKLNCRPHMVVALNPAGFNANLVKEQHIRLVV